MFTTMVFGNRNDEDLGRNLGMRHCIRQVMLFVISITLLVKVVGNGDENTEVEGRSS